MTLVPTCCGKFILDWHGPFVLCHEELDRVPPAVGGVYLLSAFTPLRPNLTPFYAGQSGNLQRRLGEHLSGQRTFAKHLRSRLSTYFSAAAVSDLALRTAAEAALIRSFTPAGNEVLPNGIHLEISLPTLALLEFIDGRGLT